MYKRLRSEKSDDWQKALVQATFALNHLSRPQLGGEQAASVTSNLDDPRIRIAKERYAETLTPKQRERLFPRAPTWQEEEGNIEQALTEGTHFDPGNFVLLNNLKKSKLGKSYDIQRQQVYLVSGVMYSKHPVMYMIKNLLGELKGNFYQDQLKLSPRNPTLDSECWLVEKVVGEKKEGNVVMFRCRYASYGAKFDQYLPSSKIAPSLIKAYKDRMTAKRKKAEQRKKAA